MAVQCVLAPDGRRSRFHRPAPAPDAETAAQEPPVATVTMKQLLESGVHFGHQTRRWNPKMKRYIFGERGGIYIIDLQQTIVLLQEAMDVVRDIAGRGGTVLFVGTEAGARTPSRSTRPGRGCRSSRIAGSAAC